MVFKWYDIDVEHDNLASMNEDDFLKDIGPDLMSKTFSSFPPEDRDKALVAFESIMKMHTLNAENLCAKCMRLFNTRKRARHLIPPHNVEGLTKLSAPMLSWH